MTYEQFLKEVEIKFTNYPKRLTHTLGVVDMAERLAIKYNLNVNDVKIAALLHDYTKYETLEFHEEYISNNLFTKYQNNPALYHALSARNYVETKFDINNKEILNAINNHVYGRIGMSTFEKVILISDKIEENRDYPKVKEFRELAFENLDLTLILFLEDAIKHNKQRNIEILDEQYEIINYLKKENHEKNTRNN